MATIEILLMKFIEHLNLDIQYTEIGVNMSLKRHFHDINLDVSPENLGSLRLQSDYGFYPDLEICTRVFAMSAS